METFLDISDLDNQIFVAVQMSEIFSVRELEQLQFNNIIIPEIRDINDPFEIFYDKLFRSDNRLQLVDVITNINNRPERCIDIRIHKTNKITLIIKCIFDTKLPIHVSNLTCLAINYSKYNVKLSNDYNMNKLAENFTTIAEEISSQKNSTDNCKSMIEYLTLIMDDINDDIYRNYHYLKQFNKGNCSYTISVHNPQMLRLTLYNIDRQSTEYIFVPRDRIGVEILIEICQRILKIHNSK